MRHQRQCGGCRECCVVLDVEPTGSEAGTPCKFLSRVGCSVYERRPNCCRAFTCAWREGLLGPADRPDKTKMVIWTTQMLSPSGKQMPVLSCDVRATSRRHKKTMRFLMNASFRIPVLIVHQKMNELYGGGHMIARWHERDFIRLSKDDFGKLEATIIPRREILATPEEEREHMDRVHRTMPVQETEEEWT